MTDYMDEIDWTDAPEWAQWAAMDEDGKVFFYDIRPKLRDQEWHHMSSSVSFIGYTPNAYNWRESLRPRPPAKPGAKFGTIAEIGAVVGDLVQWGGDPMDRVNIHQIDGNRVWGALGLVSYPANVRRWKMIQRAPAKPEPSAPKTWGEMTLEEKAALLLAHHERPGSVEFWGGVQWVTLISLGWLDSFAYRIRPEPKRETVTLYGSLGANVWAEDKCDSDGHRITFDVIDGEPDCASVKMERIE